MKLVERSKYCENTLVSAALIALLVVAFEVSGQARQQSSSPTIPPAAALPTDRTNCSPAGEAGLQSQTATPNRLSLDEARRLALAQASTFQQAHLAELIAAEDVRQARIAF